MELHLSSKLKRFIILATIILQLSKRRIAKESAHKNYQKHEELGDFTSALKFKKSATYITKEMKDDAKKMLDLLGLPVI